MWLKTYLLVTGIGAFVALAFPGLVVFGMILIVPGLILAVMPTAFLYGVVFAAVRFLLAAVLTGMPLNVASAIATAALMWAIPQPATLIAKARLAWLREDALLPQAPIKLSGHVLITRPAESRCTSMCAALLKTPGVTSVRIETRLGYSYTYKLVDKTAPGKSETPLAFGLLEKAKYEAGDPLGRQRALEAEWNLTLAERGLKLMKIADTPAPDFTIAISDGPVSDDERQTGKNFDWSLAASSANKKALELFDRQGKPLLRQALLFTTVPSAPLSIGTTGGIQSFRFLWARHRIGDGKEYAEIPVDQLLMDNTSIARGVDEASAAKRTRTELESALADPARPASDPAFRLANQWMESNHAVIGPLDDSERQLLVRIIADRRVTGSEGLWAAVKRIDDSAPDMRRLAAQRYLDAPDPKTASGWLNAFAGLPAGSYAEQLVEERTILATPNTSMYAHGLIKRQGDIGVNAVPDLLRMLRQYSTFDPGKYRHSALISAIGAVRSAFRLIGPDAAFAREDIEALLVSPGLARRHDKQGWDILLVVLGRPVDTLDKPERRSGTVESYRKRVADIAARPFDQTRD